MDIERLVISASAGDQRAIETLVETLAPNLRRWFASRYPTLDTSELTQITLIVIWQKLPGFEFRSEAAFMAWVFQIARHIGMAALRHGARFVRLADLLGPVLGAPQTGLSTLEEREARGEQLRREVEKLPRSLRLAAENMLAGGHARDLAEQLGLEWATIRVYEARAIEQLRRRLRPPTPIPPPATPESTPEFRPG